MKQRKIKAVERLLEYFNLEIVPGTPERVVRVLEDIAAPRETLDRILTGIFDEEYTGIVTQKDIPILSYCEHHLLPWFGYASIAYIAKNKVIGLSKFTRIVNYFSSGLTLQERVTKNVADFFGSYISKDVIVMVTAVHTCMVARGIKTTSAVTTSIEAKGIFRKESGPRIEFFSTLGQHASSLFGR